MLGARAGTTLVGLLTVTPDVFDQVAEVRIAPEIHERLVAWRARFGLAIDNALNFLNNPDGIQGHNFCDPGLARRRPARAAGPADAGPLQQRAAVLRCRRGRVLRLIADVLDRLVPQTDDETVDPDTLGRIKDAIAVIERRTAIRERLTLAAGNAPHRARRHRRHRRHADAGLCGRSIVAPRERTRN